MFAHWSTQIKSSCYFVCRLRSLMEMCILIPGVPARIHHPKGKNGHVSLFFILNSIYTFPPLNLAEKDLHGLMQNIMWFHFGLLYYYYYYYCDLHFYPTFLILYWIFICKFNPYFILMDTRLLYWIRFNIQLYATCLYVVYSPYVSNFTESEAGSSLTYMTYTWYKLQGEPSWILP